MRVCVWFACVGAAAARSCTTIAVDKHAMVEKATVVTHTADCFNCDFRAARVKASSLESPNLVRLYKPTYPVEVSGRSATWAASSLEFSTLNLDDDALAFEDASLAAEQEAAWSDPAWDAAAVIGAIEVDELKALAKTDCAFSSLEGLFAIANDGGLTMGESTCEGVFLGLEAKACFDCPGPLTDITSLSRIAMRSCSTARCAIRVMGTLAAKYGYYTAEQPTPGEAGEALTIADGEEAWMFHILPDDTGSSAIWAAARLPRGHISVCANSFVIRGVPDEAASFEDEESAAYACLWEVGDAECDFLLSSDAREIATRAGVLAVDGKGQLDFAASFGPRKSPATLLGALFLYSTRRVWRVMSLAAPEATAKFVASSPMTYLGGELPFSVAAEHPLDVHDILAMNREFYSGTPFAMDEGAPSGPWGDPARFDIAYQGAVGVAPEAEAELPTKVEAMTGRFERAVSLFRTSYSFAALSTGGKAKDAVWFSQGAPHAAVYAPLLSRGDVDAASSFARGSMFERTVDSQWWASTMVANWMRGNTFRFSIRDVSGAQLALEKKFASELAALPSDVDAETADKFNAKVARTALETWNRLYDKLVAKYHDNYRFSAAKRTEIDVLKYFYPKKWLEQVGFFAPKFGYHGEPNPYAAPEPQHHRVPAFLAPLALLFFALAVAAGVWLGRTLEKRKKGHDAETNGAYGGVARTLD